MRPLIVLLLAIGGGGTAASLPSPTISGPTTGPGAAAPQAPAPGADTAFVMCDLVPGPDVAGLSPFTIPFKDARPMSDVLPQGCRYAFEDAGGRDRASIGIVVTDFERAGDAQTVLRHRDQTARDNLGVVPRAVAGLGDTASVVSTGDEVALEVVTGTRVLDVSLRGQYPDITESKKIAAATDLAKLVLARLP